MSMPAWKSPLERFGTKRNSSADNDSDLFSPLQVSDSWGEDDFGENSGLLGSSSSRNDNSSLHMGIVSNNRSGNAFRHRGRGREKGGCRFCKFGCAVCCSTFSIIGVVFLMSLGFYVSAGWIYIDKGWPVEKSNTVALNSFLAAFMYLLVFLCSAHTAVYYPQGRVLSLDLHGIVRGFDVRLLRKHPYIVAACAAVSIVTVIVVSDSELYADHSLNSLVSQQIGFP